MAGHGEFLHVQIHSAHKLSIPCFKKNKPCFQVQMILLGFLSLSYHYIRENVRNWRGKVVINLLVFFCRSGL